MATSTPSRHEFLEAEEWQSMSALLMLNRAVLGELDARLRHGHRLSVSEFDVLITLFNAPDSRLRMSMVAQHVLITPAGATQLVTRLERDRLVRREPDPDDGRKWFAVLTAAGDAALRAARRTHNQVVRDTLIANTTPAERRSLQRIWQRIAASPPTP
jgi:DNA-binding MarR family transcriptional regulator